VLPDRSNGVFGGWSGVNCTELNCTFDLDGDKNITVYIYKPPALFVHKAGDGSGSVMTAPAGINCGATCSAAFVVGTTVTLTAVSGNGYFTGWSGDCTGTTPSCIFKMMGNRSVTANFAKMFNLTEPTASTLWKIRSKQSIGWSLVNAAGIPVTKQVRIDLSRDNGATWTSIFKKTANSLSKAWKVTGPATSAAKVRICSLSDTSICATSETFTIQ
jgi:uncharacterized repeat protein (TIGR02543 family)